MLTNSQHGVYWILDPVMGIDKENIMPFYSWNNIVKDTEANETLPPGMTRQGVVMGSFMFGMHESGKKIDEAGLSEGGESEAPQYHSHESEQITYVFEGRIMMTIGEEEQELGPGDFAYVPANVVHGGKALTEYVHALDIWTPPRPDVVKRVEELNQQRSI